LARARDAHHSTTDYDHVIHGRSIVPQGARWRQIETGAVLSSAAFSEKNRHMTENRWTPELLAELRGQMDPLADRTVTAIYESGETAHVNKMLSTLISGMDRPPSELPPVVRDYLEQSATLPTWLDPAKVLQGETLFGEWGIGACTILACASLPECYLMKNGIHVLAMTQRLQQHAQRRVLETAQMIMAVMFPRGLSPNGVGVRTAQKVRLMHAAMRFLILHPGTPPPAPPSSLADVMQHEEWRPEFGQPINQEDLLFTLMTFSHIGVRSLDRLGANLTSDQKDAYIHCWNIAGFIMGIREDVLPADHVEAETLFELIKAQQGGGTPEAQQMQASLLAFMENLMPHGPFKRLPVYMTRKFIGDDTADMLGVKRQPWQDRFLPAILITIWRLIDKDLSRHYKKSSHLQFGSAWIHDLLMAEIGKLPNAWNKQLFGLPTTLRADLPPDWDHPPAKAPSVLANDLVRQL
ncbi:MAG: oxygenase MpaB family protein, partial [Vicinamibacterales bacterium]